MAALCAGDIVLHDEKKSPSLNFSGLTRATRFKSRRTIDFGTFSPSAARRRVVLFPSTEQQHAQCFHPSVLWKGDHSRRRQPHHHKTAVFI